MKSRRVLMLMVGFATLGLAGSLFASAALAQQVATAAMVEVKDQTGKTVGMASFTQVGSAVRIEGRFTGLQPGFHGFHVHSVGQCTGDFTSAGPHYNPANQPHPNHAGDLPTLQVKADGTAEVRVETERFRLSELFDGDGSALVVHGSPDNFSNIPSRYAPTPDPTTLQGGDSGARVACGEAKMGAVMTSAGRTLAGEPAAIQALFENVWGDLANEQWALEASMAAMR